MQSLFVSQAASLAYVSNLKVSGAALSSSLIAFPTNDRPRDSEQATGEWQIHPIYQLQNCARCAVSGRRLVVPMPLQGKVLQARRDRPGWLSKSQAAWSGAQNDELGVLQMCSWVILVSGLARASRSPTLAFLRLLIFLGLSLDPCLAATASMGRRDRWPRFRGVLPAALVARIWRRYFGKPGDSTPCFDWHILSQLTVLLSLPDFDRPNYSTGALLSPKSRGLVAGRTGEFFWADSCPRVEHDIFGTIWQAPMLWEQPGA